MEIVYEYMSNALEELRKTEQPVLFVDMDGTMAKFTPVKEMETLFERRYFLDLEPQQSVIDAVSKLAEKDWAEVFVLSSFLEESEYALDEKNEWLDKHCPFISQNRRIFVPCGENKAEYLIKQGYHFTGKEFLLDDYSENLREFREYGAGIKLMNGINGTHGTWSGAKVDKNEISASMVKNIIDTMEFVKKMLQYNEQLSGFTLFIDGETGKLIEEDIEGPEPYFEENDWLSLRDQVVEAIDRHGFYTIGRQFADYTQTDIDKLPPKYKERYFSVKEDRDFINNFPVEKIDTQELNNALCSIVKERYRTPPTRNRGR